MEQNEKLKLGLKGDGHLISVVTLAKRFFESKGNEDLKEVTISVTPSQLAFLKKTSSKDRVSFNPDETQAVVTSMGKVITIKADREDLMPSEKPAGKTPYEHRNPKNPTND